MSAKPRWMPRQLALSPVNPLTLPSQPASPRHCGKSAFDPCANQPDKRPQSKDDRAVIAAALSFGVVPTSGAEFEKEAETAPKAGIK